MTTTQNFWLATDMALVCAYDPQTMKDHVRKSREWVYGIKDNDYGKLEQVKAGKIALWPLGGKGGRFSARVFHGSMPEEWKAFDRGQVTGMGVVVDSGHLFVGPGERIPGDGFGDRIVELEDGGKAFDCPNGRYVITVHVLDWKGDARFFDEEGEVLPDAPPDLALELAPHTGDFAPPRPSQPLTEFLPKVKHKPIPAVLPRPKITTRPEVARPAAGRSRRREAPDWKPAPDAPTLPPRKPGELGVGARVRHATFGDGSVLFIREGFPKVKVDFRGREEKVDRSELVVLD